MKIKKGGTKMLTIEKNVDSQLRISIPRKYLEKLGIKQGDTVLVSYNDRSGKIEIYKEKEDNLIK